ncbi:MAG: tRNA pseudouridine(13) synthase TruD [Planctomycetes bacterium]|nr:tRNA pseudouridine(13) synthase TruD [Planctomycetota bacterium]
MLSIEHIDHDLVRSLSIPRIEILDVSCHRNKLRRGHLRGNRFELKLREIDPGAIDRVRMILQVLERRGMANYFGPQRFGLRGDNWRVGQAVLRGDYQAAIRAMVGDPSPLDTVDAHRAHTLFDEGKYDEAARAWPRAFAREARLCMSIQRLGADFKRAWLTVDRPMRKIYINAYQSHLFNRVVAQRIDSLGQLETGDLAWIHQGGACFIVEDEVQEQPRCDALEISPSGPLFGPKMTPAQGEPGGREARILAEFGSSDSDFQTPDGMVVEGARRPLRVPLGDCQANSGSDENGEFIELTFFLPAGSYATCVTREICKNPT